jgi:HprK-related kinase B
MNWTRAKLIRNVRQDYPASYPIFLRLEDCILEVYCNTKSLKTKLSDYFKTFQIKQTAADISITVHEALPPELNFSLHTPDPEPGKTKFKEEFADLADGRIVRKLLTGMVFIFGQGQNLVIGPCEANPNQVINFINNRFIEWKLCQGALLGHAAGVLFNGRGLSLAGFSGMGKSTLALHLMSREATFVSNDRILVSKQNQGLHMTGVAKLPRINPGTALHNPQLINIIPSEERERMLQLPPEELWDLEQKYDVDIESCFGGNRFMLSGPMHGLVILNWQKNSDSLKITEVDPEKRKDLLFAFMKSAGVFFCPEKNCDLKNPSVQEYVNMLSSCTVLEISGGIDFNRAADACLHFLQSQKSSAAVFEPEHNAQLTGEIN